jgi:hypothetical protein
LRYGNFPSSIIVEMQVSALRPFIKPIRHQQQRVRLNASIELYSYFFGSLDEGDPERSTVFGSQDMHLLQHCTPYFIIGSTIQGISASPCTVILQLMGPAYSYWIVGRSFDETSLSEGTYRELWSHLCDSI